MKNWKHGLEISLPELHNCLSNHFTWINFIRYLSIDSKVHFLTGVSVEVPSDKSEKTTITLRGEPDKLGLALTQVYEKASSVVTVEVEAPKWLHRFIIGRGGQNIKKITEGSSKVCLWLISLVLFFRHIKVIFPDLYTLVLYTDVERCASLPLIMGNLRWYFTTKGNMWIICSYYRTSLLHKKVETSKKRMFLLFRAIVKENISRHV